MATVRQHFEAQRIEISPGARLGPGDDDDEDETPIGDPDDDDDFGDDDDEEDDEDDTLWARPARRCGLEPASPRTLR